MFNYAPHHEEREANNGAEFLRYHKVQNGHFNVFADRACNGGKQLVEDYGDNTNTLYINHHGFVVEENPFDCVEVIMPQVRRDERLRYKLATRLGMNNRRPFCLQPNKPLPKEVSDHTKMLAFTDDHIEACLRVLGEKKQNKVSRSSYTKCFTELNDQTLSRSRRLFNDMLKKALKSYPTTYDEDKALLESKQSKAAEGMLQYN